jgi:cyclase
MGDPSKVTLKVTPVAGGVSMIEGANGFAGGNVAVTVGNDGVFIIDDELQPLNAKLKAALATLSKKPVRFVVNTHWHSDHTGGNAAFGAGGAIIIAHDNVRKRLSVDQFMDFMGNKMTIKASPPEALPIVTFGDDLTLYVNGDEIHAIHVPPAHTDGDAIIQFKKANVIHMGDTFFSAGYPVVDVSNGGQIDGFITAADRALPLCDDATKIIPGHGPVVGRAELKAWRDMVADIRDRVAKLAAAHKTLDEIVAAKPTAAYDAKWGEGMIKPEWMVGMVFKTLPPPAAAPAKAAHKHPATK